MTDPTKPPLPRRVRSHRYFAAYTLEPPSPDALAHVVALARAVAAFQRWARTESEQHPGCVAAFRDRSLPTPDPTAPTSES